MLMGLLGVAVALLMAAQDMAAPEQPPEEEDAAEAGPEAGEGAASADDGEPADEQVPLEVETVDIEEETLPSVEELSFPELSGDFDGDGAEDTAIARESGSGVQIALELSSTGDTFVESLGADSLRSVDWEVLDGEAFCAEQESCPAEGSNDAPRDAIIVTLDGNNTFVLRWDGEALETVFLDA